MAPPDPAAVRRRPARGGVRADERALAPDLARGLMLLLILLSNTGFFLYTAEYGPTGWHPVDGSAVDRAVRFAMITALDLRVYPLFAFLFGYGMMRLYARQTAAGASGRAAVALLRRRSLWLLVFGGVHAALFLGGDILGVYGVVSLVLGALLLRRSDRALLFWAAAAYLPMCVAALTSVGDLSAAPGSTPLPEPSFTAYAAGAESALAAVGVRLTTWAFLVGFAVLGFPMYAAMLLGFWAARRRVLEEPHRHLRLLRCTAVAGVAIGWAGGLPAALAHSGLLDVPAAALGEDGLLGQVQSATGVPGGLGYAAVITLVAMRLPTRVRRSAPVRAVAATGARSLSCYLAHSALFSPVLAAWGLGLGAHLGSATVAAFAIGVWLLTVVAAAALDRAGRRGPAEALLRRLVYGRPAPTGPGAPD
jgi:uncharacterized membrane protein YeiB